MKSATAYLLVVIALLTSSCVFMDGAVNGTVYMESVRGNPIRFRDKSVFLCKSKLFSDLLDNETWKNIADAEHDTSIDYDYSDVSNAIDTFESLVATNQVLETRTDIDGKYEFLHVSPGYYCVAVVDRSDHDKAVIFWAVMCNVGPGGTVKLDLTDSNHTVAAVWD